MLWGVTKEVGTDVCDQLGQLILKPRLCINYSTPALITGLAVVYLPVLFRILILASIGGTLTMPYHLFLGLLSWISKS